jgi:hypothetical protein
MVLTCTEASPFAIIFGAWIFFLGASFPFSPGGWGQREVGAIWSRRLEDRCDFAQE